ncbi:MAG: L,D-transpeptidase [Oscillospiraceae bacterium]|nr:L,D-transpeptidase [Oscillospiraceae bacterium]
MAAAALCCLLLAGRLPAFGVAAASTVLDYGAFIDDGDSWWNDRELFDLRDPERVWSYLTRDVTVLDAGAQSPVYLLDKPNGARVKSGQYEGFLYGSSVSVNVLEISGDWAFIEGYDMTDELIQGWVRASLLKRVTPSALYGIVVDKQSQRLYLYSNGRLLSTLKVSTGLPTKAKPHQETAAGEYLIVSWTGGFWADNLWCELALRFNGGDLLHLVPSLVAQDGTKDYSTTEPYLGQRASHGCIRTQRVKTSEGINMQWLWDNLKMNTKLIVWDDDDRPMYYPDPDLILYYNPNGGRYYHSDEQCPSVRDQYLPLEGVIRYEQLRDAAYSKLVACSTCNPPVSPQRVDAVNEAAGYSRSQVEAMQGYRGGSVSTVTSVDGGAVTTVYTAPAEPVVVSDEIGGVIMYEDNNE